MTSCLVSLRLQASGLEPTLQQTSHIFGCLVSLCCHTSQPEILLPLQGFKKANAAFKKRNAPPETRKEEKRMLPDGRGGAPQRGGAQQGQRGGRAARCSPILRLEAVAFINFLCSPCVAGVQPVAALCSC